MGVLVDTRSGRRGDRICLSEPVQVCGSDPRGHQFVTQGKIQVISRHGATIFVSHRLALQQLVSIRRLSKNKEAEFRILGQIGAQDLGFTYGAALVDQDIPFWDIVFPPLTEAEKAVGRVLLDCMRCQARELVYLNEVELEVFAANQSIERFCKDCARSSLWTSDARQPTSSEDLERRHSVAASTFVPEVETRTRKRQSARLKLRMQVCVRQSGAIEEVQTTDNVSRGGLCFKSSRKYGPGSQVEVAVPYNENSANIFVPARIVYGTPLVEGTLYKYGASYVKSQS